MANWLTELFGGSTPSKMIPADVPKRLPTPEEVAAVDADRVYGDRSAAFLTAPQPAPPTTAVRERLAPVGAEVQARMPLYQSLHQMNRDFKLMNKGENPKTPPSDLTPAAREELKSGWLASQATALAALGFDPRRMMMADPEAGLGRDLNLGGVYHPPTTTYGRRDEERTTGDHITITGATQTAMPHESMHRGMQLLRGAGMLPPAANDFYEESLIRAFTNRHFGDADRKNLEPEDTGYKQAVRGEKLAKSEEGAGVMDAIEAAAAQLIAKRTPRGPR